MYHTPSGLRALTRVFILVTPWLFGCLHPPPPLSLPLHFWNCCTLSVLLLIDPRPYHILVANSTNLAFAIVTSCVTSLAMQGLFNLRQGASACVVAHFFIRVPRHELEDPFQSSDHESLSTGGIAVRREISAIKDQLSIM